MNKLLKKISYDTLLITILVSMLFIYMLITLNDSPVKESFDDEVGSKESGGGESGDGSKTSGDGADDIKDGVGDNKDGVSKSGGKVLVERVEDKGETTIINNYYRQKKSCYFLI